MRAALESLGLRSAGGNYAKLHEACAFFGIEVPRATGMYQTSVSRSRMTIALSDILVRDSTYTDRGKIKKRCFAEGKLRNECYECGIGPT